MKEQMFDQNKKVEDPEIAEEMAYVEKPYRESKRYGIFKPSESKIKEGEMKAEEVEREMKEKMIDEIIENLTYLGEKNGDLVPKPYFGLTGTVKFDVGEGIELQYTTNGRSLGMREYISFNGVILAADEHRSFFKSQLLESLKDSSKIKKIRDKIVSANEKYREQDILREKQHKEQSEMRQADAEAKYKQENQEREKTIKDLLEKI